MFPSTIEVSMALTSDSPGFCVLNASRPCVTAHYANRLISCSKKSTVSARETQETITLFSRSRYQDILNFSCQCVLSWEVVLGF